VHCSDHFLDLTLIREVLNSDVLIYNLTMIFLQWSMREILERHHLHSNNLAKLEEPSLDLQVGCICIFSIESLMCLVEKIIELNHDFLCNKMNIYWSVTRKRKSWIDWYHWRYLCWHGALNSRLPTKDNLTCRIETQLASQMCEGGCELPKTTNHMFFEYPMYGQLLVGYLALIESLLSSIK
jgi:hypothetical protein